MSKSILTLETAIASYQFEDEARFSFLIVVDPLTPFIFRRDGKVAESIMIQTFDGKSARIPHMTGERSEITKDDFLEYFAYVEFYFNQLFKLCLSDTFTTSQWTKLEYVVSSEAINMRAKMEIMKKLNGTIWGAIRPHFSDLQALRNAMAHSPVGPYGYRGSGIDWNVIDKDMASLTTNLLTEYKKVQSPVLEFVNETGIKVEE
jgi:hypothetical protein